MNGLVCIDCIETVSKYIHPDQYISIRTNTSEVKGLVYIDYVLRLYWNTYSRYSNAIRTSSILTNTHQHARILANTSWMDWSVLTNLKYWVCSEVHTVSIPVHINTSEYMVNVLVRIEKNCSYRSVFDCQSGPIQAANLDQCNCQSRLPIWTIWTNPDNAPTQWRSRWG